MKHAKPPILILRVILLGLILAVSTSFQAYARPGFPANSDPNQTLGGTTGSPSSSQNDSYSSSSAPIPTIDKAATVILTSGGDGIDAKGGIYSSSFPIRAAFYYPWFPEAWNQLGINPYTMYAPTLGYYDTSGQGIIRQQIIAMLYGHIQAGIASWWGIGTPTDGRFPELLSSAAGTNFKWAVYYEKESLGNPDVSVLNADLTYIRDHYSIDPGYLRIDDRFVVFVYSDTSDGCPMVSRWLQANTVGAYIVLRTFPGYQSCADQPDGWHQYAPAKAENSAGQSSYTISPGFWKVGESPRLDRSLKLWQQSIKDMIASGANFQLITTFNEWGEGTAVESAGQWHSASGYGAYLDALHQVTLFDRPTVMPSAAPSSQDPVVIAAGDIADCKSNGDQLTAALINNKPDAVITLGDNVYESGTTVQYDKCYAPSWGQFKAITHPSAGNHDYLTKDATGYFTFFGAAAGDPTKGYYSYEIGSWHIVVLNANCSAIGGCDINSPQVTWLQADLSAHPTLCTLAYWHQPRFSSGEHGNTTNTSAFWQVLYQAGVDLVLNGHDHDYERFAPQSPAGVADPVHGIREFVVGTGGKNLRPITTTIANSEVHNDSTWGVLQLTLHPASYDWRFLPVAGQTFTDSGSGACH